MLRSFDISLTFLHTFASVSKPKKFVQSKIAKTMSKDKIDPGKVSKWITAIIAILSAIAGALGESATHVMGSIM